MRFVETLALVPLVLAAPRPMRRSALAPLIVPRDAQLVEGSYIVRMKAEAAEQSISSTMELLSAPPAFTYTDAFNGFAGSLTPEELETIRANPDVEEVEQDALVSMFESPQQDADWGLARLSDNKPGGTTYTFDNSAGEGTCAYVIDTGVDASHPDFEGRAKMLKSFVRGGGETDDHGHGTHVCGTIASKTFGVAKKAKVFGVKVLDASGGGSNSVVMAGMDFVTKDARNQTCPKGAVANMSLGGTKSKAINAAAEAMIKSGVMLIAAAGNDGKDAVDYSPASTPGACTIGATTIDDKLASYSNIGSMVDVLAPGSNITSTWMNGETKTISGTSMAAPHVAGLAAYFLGMGQKKEGLCEFMAKNSLKDVIKGVPTDTVNLLIHNKANNGTRGPLEAEAEAEAE
ncbi:hypothetical protein CDD82_1192 [Ophiocordyceps australis]|uniref:Peptidase S8/S53 domain-containing protein n=1 Tax=Ophiocordyceps australis TaxID=1399860 RepID=A0A2C5ZN45_9HYPO|nr:hypothetical protein CDD82_1192 [Ophiocordyceps australis]